jgi:sulfur-oxidizing protein SoxY
MTQRRELLAGLIGAAVVPNLGAQTLDVSAQAWMDQLTKGQPVRQGRVELTLPRLADNGLSVPFRVWVDSPMTAQDHVTDLWLLSQRNPVTVMAKLHLGPHLGRAEFSTRVRLA